MSNGVASTRLRGDDGERHATWLELFFDLCFVAAVAALASVLHDDHSPEGIARFAALFVPIWWVWMGYTWYATAFDNDDTVFRLGYLGGMLGVITLAATASDVIESGSQVFPLAYAAMFALLSLLFVRAARAAGEARRFALVYAAGDLAGAALWGASPLVSRPAAYAFWAAGLVVLMATPVLAVRSYVGRAYNSSHIPERYGLFTLIVLGESVVAVSAGLAETGLDRGSSLVAVAGFVVAAGVWWTYFDHTDAASLDRGKLRASFTWGYGHLLVFAGIAAASVGIELAAEAAVSGHDLSGTERALLCGGLATFYFALAAIGAVGGVDGRGLLRFGTAVALVASAALVAGPVALAVTAAALVVAEVFLEAQGVTSTRPGEPARLA